MRIEYVTYFCNVLYIQVSVGGGHAARSCLYRYTYPNYVLVCMFTVFKLMHWLIDVHGTLYNHV